MEKETRQERIIKCEVIEQFELKEFDKLKNIKRFNINFKKDGWLYLRDTFECDVKMFKYLNGNNDKGKVVVKLIEII